MFKIRIKTVISENDMVGSSPYLFFRFAKSRFRSLDLKLRDKNIVSKTIRNLYYYIISCLK
jgi:hypothetical protein